MLAPRRAAVAVPIFLLFFLIIRTATQRHVSKDPQINHSSTESTTTILNERPLLPSTKHTFHAPADRNVFDSGVQKPLRQYPSLPLRQRLAIEFPYEQLNDFPKYIWQTWKYTPSSWRFGRLNRALEHSWTALHPQFVHEVITDATASYMIRHIYSAFPDIIDAYAALPRPVLKADFFRYLILLARGGIYTDVDTAAMRDSQEWIPRQVRRSSIGLVIGIEADPDREDWADWYSRRIQFCQWTIQAKPGHPVLREIVAKITENTLRRQTEGTFHHDDVHNVIEFTGPGLWTDIIFNYFNDAQYFDLSSSSEDISWKQFTRIKDAKIVGDVVVLPITCFSPGIRTMGAGEDDDQMAMVKHLFEGMWKPENERHVGEG